MYNNLNVIYAMEQHALRNHLASFDSSKLYSILPSILSTKGSSVARINISGFLYSTKYQAIKDAADTVAYDTDITTVVLLVDSYGGSVHPDINVAWQSIYNLRTRKKVFALNVNAMASAAYWLASAAEKIFSVHELTQQGSVGVYAAFTDWTGFDEKNGIKEVRIVSKNAPNKNLPTNDPKLVEQVQVDIDHVEGVMLRDIAKGRGVSVATVSANYGQGAMLITPDAVRTGMIDGIATLEQIVSNPNDVTARKIAVETQPIRRERTVEERVNAIRKLQGKEPLPSSHNVAPVSTTSVTQTSTYRVRTVEERIEALRRMQGKI